MLRDVFHNLHRRGFAAVCESVFGSPRHLPPCWILVAIGGKAEVADAGSNIRA
jgi:hypothetical protein